MDPKTLPLLEKIQALEAELEGELTQRRADMRAALQQRTAALEQGVRDAQRRAKLGLLRFLRETSLNTYLVAPVIYSLILPVAVLDAWVTLYQWICFPAYGIPRVRRGDYIALDRRLPFLNAIEKLNCVYCGYANGVLAYAREIASRTEQYWCPLKHQRHIAGAHHRYYAFLDPDVAETYRARLDGLRQDLAKLERGEP